MPLPGLTCGRLFKSYVGRMHDKHVIPERDGDRHLAAPECWCGPDIQWTDTITLGRVFVHHLTDEVGN